MTDENCLYCNREGECTKGLPGTPCEIEGCVAHTPVGYLSWGDMTDKEKSDFLWAISHQEACSKMSGVKYTVCAAIRTVTTKFCTSV